MAILINVSFSNAPPRAGLWFGSEGRALDTSDRLERHLVSSIVVSTPGLGRRPDRAGLTPCRTLKSG